MRHTILLRFGRPPRLWRQARRLSYAVALLLAVTCSAQPLYTLTVSNGLGSGSYTQGAVVAITASNPPPGQVFDVWQRNTRYIANPWAATTTFTMPGSNATTTAKFRTVYPNGWQIFADPGNNGLPQGQSSSARLFVDTTHIYYTTLSTGVWRAALSDRLFLRMPTNGLALSSASSSNSFDVTDVIATPQGTVVVSLVPHPLNVNNTNALHYWFHPTNGVWLPVTYVNRPYPFLYRAANLVFGPDGALWSGSGFVPYVYRSTDGGRTFTAFNLNERVPPDYLPLPLNDSVSFGMAFGVAVAANGVVYSGTESAGFLRSADNGVSWTSLDSNFTDPNSLSPLGRAGNCAPSGFDRLGHLLCNLPEMAGTAPGYATWSEIKLAGYDEATRTAFKASHGLPPAVSPGKIVLTAAGENFTMLRQETENSGGIFRSSDGAHWTQFNLGIPVMNPPIAGTLPSDSIAVFSNRVFVATADGRIWYYDSLPNPAATNLYALTVVNGGGSGNFPSGAIVPLAADPPGIYQLFNRWTNYPVANPLATNTTLMMPASNVTVTATYKPTPSGTNLYPLTVINGSGSGSYTQGAVVAITANTAPGGMGFDWWTGTPVTDAFAASTTLVMPAEHTNATANYRPLAASSIPQPVASHPRLWLTTNDLPRLRAWATMTNPVYVALRTLLTKAIADYDTRYFPGGAQNPHWPDFGDAQGYSGLLTEMHAFLFAFFSLIDHDATQRPVHAQRAASLIRVALAEAAKGTAANEPFRDKLFSTYNRANATLECMPMAVDWIYNAVGTNGQPVLTAFDKRTIRNGFLTWSDQCVHAYVAGNDAPPLGALNDPAVLLPNNRSYRMAANNYYLGHARLLTLMALAIDPVDDPPVNPALPDSAETNSLRAYITNATGAWLYQEYAMFGDGPQVALDYGLPGGGAGLGLGSGGMPAEGTLYGHSFAFLLGKLLALQTAGYNNPALTGPQCHLIGAPVWDRFCDAWISLLTPQPKQIYTFMPPAFQFPGYGDMLRLFVTPDDMQMFALLALLDEKNGQTNRLGKSRWFAINAPVGGATNLIERIVEPWSWQESVLYFLLLDPAQPPPTDPRPAMPTFFHDAPQGIVVARTDWSTNATMLQWRCSWNSINHQNADAGLFQFHRRGEFLTKEYSGYDNTGYGQASLFHNTLSLQNKCAAGKPFMQWYEEPLWETGSQFIIGLNAGDPRTAASHGPGYVFGFGDLTPLYNRPSFWTPTNAALDVLHASRSLLWLEPDHLVIYDRATSKSDGLFKRFDLMLPAAPATNASGSLITSTLPSGQKLFISPLLPTNRTAKVHSLFNEISFVAEGDNCQSRITIEDPNHPANIRFLHVLQGADAGISADAATYVQSSGGTPFEGAAVRGALVLFPVNQLSNYFAGLSYAAPAGVTNHFIAGLPTNATFTAAFNGPLVSLTPGGPLSPDLAGVLNFTADDLSSVRILSAIRSNNVFQITASGPLTHLYVLEASTNLVNWQAILTNNPAATPFQVTEPAASNQPVRFYRLRSN